MGDLGNKKVMAKNINVYMSKNRETRNDLCDLLGVPYNTVTNWVKGKTYPRIDKIEMMANHWGIKKSDLVEDNESPLAVSSERDDPVTAQIMDIVRQMTPEERRLYLENLKTLLRLQEQGRKPDIQE